MTTQHTAPQALALSMHGRQMHWLHAAEVAQIFCQDGSIQLEWQLHGLPCSAVLHAEDAPWNVPRLPTGSLIGIRLQRQVGCTSATVLASQRKTRSLLVRLAQALHLPVTKTHNHHQNSVTNADYKLKRLNA